MSDTKRGVGRPAGALNTRTQDLQKRFVELTSDEMFSQVFLSLITVAISGDRDADKVNAAKYLLDRWLGKVPDVVTVQGDSQSVSDILQLMKRTTQQESAQQATESADEPQ